MRLITDDRKCFISAALKASSMTFRFGSSSGERQHLLQCLKYRRIRLGMHLIGGMLEVLWLFEGIKCSLWGPRNQMVVIGLRHRRASVKHCMMFGAFGKEDGRS